MKTNSERPSRISISAKNACAPSGWPLLLRDQDQRGQDRRHQHHRDAHAVESGPSGPNAGSRAPDAEVGRLREHRDGPTASDPVKTRPSAPRALHRHESTPPIKGSRPRKVNRKVMQLLLNPQRIRAPTPVTQHHGEGVAPRTRSAAAHLRGQDRTRTPSHRRPLAPWCRRPIIAVAGGHARSR